MDFASLKWENKINNTPGLRNVGYYAPKSWLANFPDKMSSPSNMSEYAYLESTPGFVFNTGGFLSIQSTEAKAKVTTETQGENDCRSYLNKYSFLYPGTQAEAVGWCRRMNNTDCVFLAIEINGTVRVIGNMGSKTVFKITATTGAARTDQKGITIEVSCTDPIPKPIYTGDILTLSSLAIARWHDSAVWHDSEVWTE